MPIDTNLRLPTPTGLDAKTEGAFDEVIAPLQRWASAVDGWGKWVEVDPATILLRVDDDGNSWTSLVSNKWMQYRLVGNSMMLNFQLINTTLTITTAVLGIHIGLPPGFGFVSGLARVRRFYNPTYLNVGGTVEIGFLTGPQLTTEPFISVLRAGLANWATASVDIQGQIELEVERI